MSNPSSLVLVLGIDPGGARPASLAAWCVLSLDPASGTVAVLCPPVHVRKDALTTLLADEPLLSDPRLRLAAMAAPMTPLPLERKPWKARLVEIRFSRGAFSGTTRGPSMPWLSSSPNWLRYQQAALLRAILQDRGFQLLAMPADEQALEFPSRGLAEVYPKLTLALFTSAAPPPERPPASKLFGQLDDWLFPRLFTDLESESSPPPILSALRKLGPGLRLAPELLNEARRIAGLRRPFPRREPLRAFIAAFQGILALWEAACLVGAAGDSEGSLLLPATWHPDWESEWRHARRADPLVRRAPVRCLSAERAPYPLASASATIANCATSA